MLEGKKGNISVFVERTPYANDVAVCLSVKSKLNTCCLNKLKQCGACNCFPSGSEEACLCYAMYSVARNLLCGDPVAMLKYKVGSLDCGAHNGQFYLCWKVKANISAIRKSIGAVLRVMNPGKLYSAYATCVKEAGGKPSRDGFGYVADELAKSIKDSVVCAIVGGIKLEKLDSASGKKRSIQLEVDGMVDVLHKKIKVDSVKDTKKKPSDHKECDHSNFVELKSSGWETAVLKNYLNTKIRGLSNVVCDKYILLHVKPKQWDTLASKLKAAAKEYVATKYTKAGDFAAVNLAYLAISNADLGSSDIKALIKSSPKASELEKAITGSL